MAGVIVVVAAAAAFTGPGTGGGDGEDCDDVDEDVDEDEDEDGGRRDRTDQVGLEKVVLRPESGCLISSGAGGCEEPGDCDMLRRHMYDVAPAAVVVLKRQTLGTPLASTRLGCMVVFLCMLFSCPGVVDTAVLLLCSMWI